MDAEFDRNEHWEKGAADVGETSGFVLGRNKPIVQESAKTRRKPTNCV